MPIIRIAFTLWLILLGFGSVAQVYLPQRCSGKWAGMLYIYQSDKLVDSMQTVHIVEAVEEKNKWTWRTEYSSGSKEIIKDYVLILRDSLEKEYLMDEKNGIGLLAFEFGNRLYSNFIVQEQILTASYEFYPEEEKLTFNITSASAAGDAGKGVKNYKVNIVQRAVLRKVKE